MNRKDLINILKYEEFVYKKDVFYSKNSYASMLKNEAPYRIWRWQRLSRISDYYHIQMTIGGNFHKFCMKVLYAYYMRRKQKIGEKLGLEIGTENIGRGLVIFHYNNVINANTIMGENCHLHGTNVVGNNGITKDAPVIGNNVMIGAGAKIIGAVKIADNIKVAAGAVVITSFTEPGITIGGIPAHKLK